MTGLTLQDPAALWLLLLLPLVWWGALRLGVLERPQGRSAAAWRSLVVVALVLALAGLSLLRRHDELAVIFVVDASRSIDGDGEGSTGGSRRARAFVAEALAARPEADMSGVVVFGGAPEIESIVRAGGEGPLWASRPPAGGTDVEAALRLALASFPPDTHRRIVLLSDGIETHGRARQQAVVARELGVPIDVVALPSMHTGPDVIVEALVAPPKVEASQPFDLRLQVRSPAAMDATLRLYQGDELTGEVRVKLGQGLDVLTVPQVLKEGGLHRFRAVIEADGDAEPRNNEARAAVEVAGLPRVLLLEGYKGGSGHLAAALRESGFALTEGGPEGLPDTLEDMAAFDAIILSDVSGTDMSREQMVSLERYVADLGQGLIMIGGDRSFGLGGYYKTPVERALPVSMTRQAQVQMPSQGIAMAIDRSGSMAGFGEVSKMELAKEAGVAVVELMKPGDELGVLGFDGMASWVVPYEVLTDKDEAIRRIGTLRAGGGTDIYNALRAAHEGIRGGRSSIKHVILLSDGISEVSDLPAKVAEMRQDKITLTTVSIGGDSDRYTMEKLAALGGGRYYETESPDAIPQIFTRETMLSSRSFLIEQPFVPEAVEDSEVLRGIEGLPQLDGYVATTLKPRATLALQAPEGEPLLAHWRLGLGRSLAFTSDAKGRWASAWITEPSVFGPFWSQAVRWVTQTGASDALALSATLRGGGLQLTVDALAEGAWREGAETQATILHPGGRREVVPLRQIAPGRYSAEVEASDEGTWFVAVQQLVEGKEVGRAVRELHRSWSPEFAPAHTGLPLLQELASNTGGRLDPAPAAVWAHPDTPLTTPRPLAPWLIAALALLWLVDVAWRRLEGFKRTSASAPVPRPSITDALALPRASSPGPPALPPRAAISADEGSDEGKGEGKSEGGGEGSAPPAAPPQFTSRLLEAKKRSRKG